jgi:hypothetical protein
MVVEASVTARSTGHVSRVAITNSREDLTSTRTTSPEVFSQKNPSSVQKKSVTKINIGSGLVADAVVPSVVDNVAVHSRSKSVDAQKQKPADVKKPTQNDSDELSSIDNNNVITKPKGRSVSSNSGRGMLQPSPQPEPVIPQHALVDKRNSNGSSTTTSVSKTSSANLSGSYHHLHHLSEVLTDFIFMKLSRYLTWVLILQ